MGAALLALLGVLVVSGSVGPSAASGGLGGLDPSFGATAEPGIGAAAVSGSLSAALALDPGDADSIVIAGSSGLDMAVGMLSSSGIEQSQATLPFFAPGIMPPEQVAAVASAAAVAPSAAPPGDVVVAGNAGTLPAVAFLSPSGASLDPSFNDGGTYMLSIPGASGEDGSFSALVVDGNDVYAVGSVVVSGSAEIVVARFVASGLDLSFGGGSGYVLIPFPLAGELGSTVSAAALDPATPDGDIVVAGWLHVQGASCAADEAFLAGITPAGTLDSTFSGGGQWFLSQPNGSCGNSRFDALTIDDAHASSSDDILVAGSQFAAGDDPSGATSQSDGLLAEYAPPAPGEAGFALHAAFGHSGLLLTGGSGGINEFDSVALLPNALAPGDPGVIVAGQEYTSALEAFQLAVQKYDINGVADTSFGSSGTTLLQCGDPGVAGCGSALGVQPTGAIEVGGGLEGQTTGASGVTTGLAVAQLADRSVTVAGPTSDIDDSSGGASAAEFMITVSSPSDPNLTGLGTNGLPVEFATENGTGRSGSNYTAESGTVIFPCPAHNQPTEVSCAGATEPDTATVTVPTSYPSNATGSATFSLVLVNATGASISVSSASATIEYPAQQGPGPSPPTTTLPRRVATTTTLPKPPSTPPAAGAGYWVVTSAGSVFAYGDAWPWGSLPSGELGNASVVAIAATHDGLGFWLVSSTGQVFPFGDAHGYGSVGKKRLSGTIVGFVPNAAGTGYWMVSSTGHVYGFGKARSDGSVPKKKLVGSITAFSVAAGGKGYWLVSSAGPVYALGKVRFYGGLPARKRAATVVDIAAASARGYWLLTSAGRVYAYGTAHNYGSVRKASLNGSAVSIVPTPDSKGYWVTSSQGSVYNFGDAKSYGSPAQANVTSIVGAATT